MNPETLKKLNIDTQEKINELTELSKYGFSEEWGKLARDIAWDILIAKDNNIITYEEWRSIRIDVLKSYGILDGDANFLSFALFSPEEKENSLKNMPDNNEVE